VQTAVIVARPRPTGMDSVFRRDGEYWTIAYAGAVVRLRDSRGLQYLAQLLSRPGERVASADLQAAAGPGRQCAVADPAEGGAAAAERSRMAVTKRIKGAVDKIEAHHPALGYHLRTSIKTGAHCTYLPDPTRVLVWEIA
jgi:hypothetical protein